MGLFRLMIPSMWLVLTLTIGGTAMAQGPFAPGWTLQANGSRLNFQTVKSQTIVESSGFAAIRGEIDPNGKASVTISLDSVDTAIDLRNVRMRFLFFETFKFPEATVTLQLNAADLRDLMAKRRITLNAVKYNLNLHGLTKEMTTDLVVTLLSDTIVSVSSRIPISVPVTDFALLDGVRKLEEAAQVPIIPSGTVSFDFLFQQNGSSTAPKPAEAAVPPAQTALEKVGELDTEACAGRFEILSRTGAIYFQTGSTDLDAESKPLLDSIVEIAKRCPKLRIQVAGHTDSIGDPASNKMLSEGRAKAVVRFLTVAGIAATRLESVGLGDTKPVAPNDSAWNRSRNRRIAFSVIGGS